MPIAICVVFSIALRFLSQHQDLGGYLYILLFSLSSLSIYFAAKNKKASFKSIALCISLCSLVLLGTEPLHENDHYRYLWEGKVAASGYSPYQYEPQNKKLEKIQFDHKDRIGYPFLTSIYPPLSLTYFSLFKPFNYFHALMLLQITQALLLILLFYLLQTYHLNNKLLLATLPFLLKEYVQSVHIDLLAFVLFFIGLHFKSYLGVIASALTKVLSIFYLPYQFMRKQYKEFFLSTFLLMTSVIAFYIFIPFKLNDNSGVSSFAKHWKWNSGFYEVLQNFTSLDHPKIKMICFACFALFYLLVLMKEKRKFYFLSLVFAGLFFFSPVYNAWYGIWLLIPALIINNHLFVVYAMASTFSYIHYGHPELMIYSSGLTHVLFLLGFIAFNFESTNKFLDIQS